MADGTGACGINCHVCVLFRQGKCSPCGPGDSAQAQRKLAAQLKAFGGACAILQCAVQRKVGHCGSDCDKFPCLHFMEGPYPFSSGYLQMQIRRRSRPANKPAPGGGKGPDGGGSVH